MNRQPGLFGAALLDRLATVSSALPIIYTPRLGAGTIQIRAPWYARLVALGIALGCLTVLLLAAWLRPDPTGFGTHRQLGLEPCAFLARTGVPCFGCGMTTSFAWFAHGHLLNALYTQPMGALLALLSCMAVWVGLYVAISGRAVYRLLQLVNSRYYYMPLLSWGLVGWAWKIFIHVRHLEARF